jgi:hypothetical protein
VFPITIKHLNYKSYKGRIVLKPGRVTTLEQALESPAVRIQISSVPSKALVTFGKEDVGRTPFSRLVPANEVIELRLIRSGYKPYNATITPADSPKLNIKLQRRRRGKRPAVKRKKPSIKL